MKRALIIIILFFLQERYQVVNGQTTFKIDPKTTTFIGNAVMECIYNHIINAPLENNPKETKPETSIAILQANATVSKFWDWRSYRTDSIIYSCSSEEFSTSKIKKRLEYYRGVKYFFYPVIYKNYPTGRVTTTDIIFPIDYIYDEKKSDRDWVLKEDTMTVCGYLCNKAVISYGGREWTAWYTPEIAISDGPWKLYGLPGLILKAVDSTNTHIFEAKTILKSGSPVYIAKNSQLVKTKRDKFVQTRNKLVDSNRRYMGSDRTIWCSPYGASYIDNKRFPYSLGTKYCPLELE